MDMFVFLVFLYSQLGWVMVTRGFVGLGVWGKEPHSTSPVPKTARHTSLPGEAVHTSGGSKPL